MSVFDMFIIFSFNTTNTDSGDLNITVVNMSASQINTISELMQKPQFREMREMYASIYESASKKLTRSDSNDSLWSLDVNDGNEEIANVQQNADGDLPTYLRERPTKLGDTPRKMTAREATKAKKLAKQERQ
jgi:hypothetical protein